MNTLAIREAQDLLESLGFPAIVAGGAIRDAVLYRAVKDFDVYAVDTPGNRRALFDRFRKISLAAAGQYETGTGILTVFNANEEFRGKPVQVMLVRQYSTAMHYVEDVFDYGLCKAYLSQQEGLVLHPEFVKDVLQRTLTYYPNPNNRFCETRAAKLRAKFPDFEFKGPK